MELGDVPAVAALEAVVFAGNAWSRDAWDAEVRAIEPSMRRYLVARRDGAVAGYAGIMRSGSDADVLTVAVAPDHRRRGIGRALVRGLLEAGRQWRCLAVFLEVAQENDAALRMYRDLGFSELGQRRHYYGPDRHAVTMRLQLREPAGSLPIGGQEP